MFKAGKTEITRTDFQERYRKHHGEEEGLSELGCALAWAYFHRMNAFFPSEDVLDQFIAGTDKRFISLNAKFREVGTQQFFRMVTGEEDPADELLSHLFWEMLEKEPDTGSINFDDAELSDEEYEKNQKAVEKRRYPVRDPAQRACLLCSWLHRGSRQGLSAGTAG